MNIVRIGMAGARLGAELHLDNYKGFRGSQVEITGVDCVEVIYAAYLSAAEGRRVDL